jgi:c-di-GMP-binding flagellar brake protein YcgR
MGFLRRLLKRRKHPRYYTTNRSLVVVSPYNSAKEEKKFQLLDISEGGCSFIYDGIKEELDERGFLSLVADDTPCLKRVAFIAISDNSLHKTQNISGGFRRRGVEFKRLELIDRKRLKEFIEQQSICRSS